MPFQLNNYSFFKKISSRGMDELFLAVNLSDNKIVTIKKSAMPSKQKALFLKRFHNDVDTTASLSHKGIISIIEYGHDESSFYTVMENIGGCDFNTLIFDHSFDRPVGLIILTEGLQALHFSHTRGIVHCNFTPANLLIGQSGRVVITDFGLSQQTGKQTRYSHFATPLFMPPEQAFLVSAQTRLEEDQLSDTTLIEYNKNLTPEAIRTLTERNIQWDIWAAGVLLYRVCSGRYPFYSPVFSDLLKEIIYGDPANIFHIAPDVPKPVATIIRQCLQKEPHLRPLSLDPIIDVLQEYFFSMSISNFREIIAAYLKERNGLLLFSPENHGLSNDIESLHISGENNSQKTESQQKVSLTSSSELSTASDLQLSSQLNQHTIRIESGWEFYEYKTLQYMPPPPGLLPGKIKQLAVIPPKLLLTAHNGIKSLTFRLHKHRIQIIPVFIVLAALTIIIIPGAFISKRLVKRQGTHAGFSLFKNKKRSDFPEQAGITFYSSETTTDSTLTVTSDIQEHSIQPENDTTEKSKPLINPTRQAVNTSSSMKSQLTLRKLPFKSQQLTTNSPSQTFSKSKRVEASLPESASFNNADITEAAPGILKISVDPPDAHVYVNGTLISKTDLESGKKVPKGSYAVTADASGFQSYSSTVLMEADKTVILTLLLKPDVKGNGQLHMYSYPWANLYIDGELVGTTPTAVPVVLVEGFHKLVLKRDGYQPYTEEVTVKAGDFIRLQAQLKKAGE
jgi:serine/threonine protein kinase